jgi:hypothetical protein
MHDIRFRNGFLHSRDSIININSISSLTIEKQKTYEKVSVGVVKKLLKPNNISKSRQKLSSVRGLIILCIVFSITIYSLPPNYVNDPLQTSLYWCSPFLLFIVVFLSQSIFYKVSAYKRVEEFTNKEGEEFILSITTSSGERILLNSLNESYLINLREEIISHIESTTKSIVNYSVVSDTVTINNNTKNYITSHIYGDHIIQNINNYEVNLSPADKEFLQGDFQKALTHIYKEISNQNNDQIKQKFEELKIELNTKKPTKNKLVSIFSVFKGLSTASDFVEAANTVMQGFNLLG